MDNVSKRLNRFITPIIGTSILTWPMWIRKRLGECWSAEHGCEMARRLYNNE